MLLYPDGLLNLACIKRLNKEIEEILGNNGNNGNNRRNSMGLNNYSTNNRSRSSKPDANQFTFMNCVKNLKMNS